MNTMPLLVSELHVVTEFCTGCWSTTLSKTSSTISVWKAISVCWGPYARYTNSLWTITTDCWASCFNSYSRNCLVLTQSFHNPATIRLFYALFFLTLRTMPRTMSYRDVNLDRQGQQITGCRRGRIRLYQSRAIRKRSRRMPVVLFQMSSVSFQSTRRRWQHTVHVKWPCSLLRYWTPSISWWTAFDCVEDLRILCNHSYSLLSNPCWHCQIDQIESIQK